LIPVTGASSGIGLASARELAREGARVILAELSLDTLQAEARSEPSAGLINHDDDAPLPLPAQRRSRRPGLSSSKAKSPFSPLTTRPAHPTSSNVADPEIHSAVRSARPPWTIATPSRKGKAMTTDPDRPAAGQANIAPGAEAGSIRDAEVAALSITSEKDRVERARMRSVWPTGEVEDTDLERRVLAHERILQALIAHIAETEPEFIARLSAVFSETPEVGRREHDYTDTHAYADQFMQNLLRLVARRTGSAEARRPMSEQANASDDDMSSVPAQEGRAVTLLEVGHRSGIWAITKDGQFYGHFIGGQPAFDAAEAAAFAIVASGGAADVVWDDSHSQSGASDGRSGVAQMKLPRTMKFRAGSARIVR
jgi:NAD(P)-dependent dehydrogenase (short-subunit alcohol dehydrogenase family)